jgi:hypothetical protein
VVYQVRQETDPETTIRRSGSRHIGDWRSSGISTRWGRCLGWRKAAGKGQAAILARLGHGGVLRSALGAKDKIIWHITATITLLSFSRKQKLLPELIF